MDAARAHPPPFLSRDSLSLSLARSQRNRSFLFFPIRTDSAGAAATLRAAPRPFLLGGVFKSEEGEETAGGAKAGGAGASSSAGGDSASSSPPANGVAAAAAAVLSLSLGATLGSVSDAAVRSSALLPGRGGGGGGDENEQEEDDDELNEWMARHTVDFLDAAALLQGALSHQYCTPETCPAMRAGPRHEYLWAEPEIPGGGGGGGAGEGSGGEGRGAAEALDAAAPPSALSTAASPPAAAAAAKKKKQQSKRTARPSRLPARDYSAALFSWADSLLASPRAFPQARGEPFPPGFKSGVLRPLFRRLARVFAHVYFAHWPEVSDPAALGASAHLNTVFKHYVAFGREHGLLPEAELDPVRPLVEALLPPAKREEEEEKQRGELPPKAAAAAAAKTKTKGATTGVQVSASAAAVA